MSVRFSVVIPVYNVAPFLRECLDSLLAQTCADWEAICVDDGSSDGSGEILDEYKTRDSRFVVIHQTNAGVGAARNAGLGLAKGAWTYFVDPDDVVHPRLLEVLSGMVDRHPEADAVSFRWVGFYDGDGIRWHQTEDCTGRAVDISGAVPLEICETFVWTVALRRASIGELRFTALQLCEDRLFLLSFFETARSVVLSGFVGYQYRLHRNSASHAVPTVRKFLDTVHYLRTAAATMDHSTKTYPARARRLIGLQLSENLSVDYRKLRLQDRRRVSGEWHEALRAVIGGIWCVMPAWVYRLVRWLKLHGINRKLAWHAGRKPWS